LNILEEIAFDSNGFEKALGLIKSLDNPNRLLILCLLCYKDLNVSEMAEAAELSMSAVSQHLSVLKQADLVISSKSSQTVTYSLKGEEVRQVIELLKTLYCG